MYSNIHGIKTFFVSNSEITKHKVALEKRFLLSKTVKGTKSYHCFVPSDSKTMLCKLFSTSENFVSVKCTHSIHTVKK